MSSLDPKTVVSLQAIDSNYESETQYLKRNKNVAIQVVFAGTTVTGTLSVEVSVDGIGSNWSTYPGSSQSLAAAGQVNYNLSDQIHPFFRIKWVNSSSSVDATMTIKTFEK